MRQKQSQLFSRTSWEWSCYFLSNTTRHQQVEWAPLEPLTQQEQHAVVRSIQIFQLGESGEGRHFLRCAEREAERSGDWMYLRALRMFLHEEHRHAAYLGEVLQASKVPTLEQNWTDGIFRWLRHRAGLELTIMVLLTAELIAQVYYQALRDATTNQRLRQICRIVLRDEQSHVRFQAERLALLRASHSRVRRWLARCFEHSLFLPTITVVWFTHRSVFRAAGMSWSRYWSKLWRCFGRSQTISHARAVDSANADSAIALQSVSQNDRYQAKWLD
jgi:hypothetical protein